MPRYSTLSFFVCSFVGPSPGWYTYFLAKVLTKGIMMKREPINTDKCVMTAVRWLRDFMNSLKWKLGP